MAYCEQDKTCTKLTFDNDNTNVHAFKSTKVNILLGCPSIISTKRMLDLLRSLSNLSIYVAECHIRVVVTEQSHTVFNDEKLIELAENVYTDEHEWNLWQKRGDPVLHIELTKWADIFVIAPLDLNTLAKIAVGICDDLLTCIVRAWNVKKPLLFCSAFPPKIRNQQLTVSHLKSLQSWGYKELTAKSEEPSDNSFEYPMAEPDEISKYILQLLSEKG